MAMSENAISEWDNDHWRDRAACLNTDPDRFFPAGNTGDAIDQIEAAKAICRVCPVQEPCLQYHARTNQEAGVWGGRDEVERRRLRKAWRASRRPSINSINFSAQPATGYSGDQVQSRISGMSSSARRT